LKKEKIMAEENQMDQGPAVPPQVEEKAERGVRHARKAATDVGSAVGMIAEKYQGRAETVWSDARSRVRSFHHDSERYVRQNPVKAVFSALTVGFVLGMIFRR
jgi:ElaB/YqjD/DUF883 family membrane-anchored ribosome-binding protein